MSSIKFLVLLGVLCLCKCDEQKGAKDSYLKAYAQTKILNEKSDTDAYYPDNSGYPGDGYPGNGYHETTGYEKPYYGPPKPEYGPPKPEYGPPKPEYGPPKPEYGPPKPVYGPPVYHPIPNYPPPPPPQPWGPPDQFIPHALLGVLDKIKYKLDLLTIGKIILKLVIFKKIVAFIGILCLLLFIPSLKNKHIFMGGGNNDDDMFRSMNHKNPADDRIENISSFVMESIGKFSKANNDSVNCKSMLCKTQRLSKYIEDKMPYEKLINLYSNELS